VGGGDRRGGGGRSLSGLWRDVEFRRFWSGNSVSDFGTSITSLALPLTAIAVLDAGALEMGVLVALGQAPVPLLGLFAGVHVDRRARLPLMLAAQLGRALLLALVPAAALLGWLRIEQLYAIAFGVGCLTVVFDLAATSYLPSLVARSDLLDANGKLQMAHQVAAVAGRGAGGALVQAITAPLAIAVDAVSYLMSAALIARIRRPEPALTTTAAQAGVGREIAEGLRFTIRQPLIAAMIVTSTLGSFGGALQQAVLFLFLANALALSPLAIGVATGVGALAAWGGARLARPVGERLGPGRAMIAAGFLYATGAALTPLAGLVAVPALLVVTVGQSGTGLSLTLFSVNQISLRQALTPDALLGRVNATRRVFVFGAIPFGALAGGVLGETFGLREALVAGAAASLISALYALASPLRRRGGAGPAAKLGP